MKCFIKFDEDLMCHLGAVKVNNMKYLIVLFFIPISLFSQKVNEFWVTPIANIEFSESKIIYYYSLDECRSFENLKPIHYNRDIMEMKGVFGTGCIDDYKDMFNQLHLYLEEWQYGIACNKDKYTYLKATSLLIIWNIHWMKLIPDNSPEILGYLENDMSIEISRAAKMVLKLDHEYKDD